MPAQVRGRNRLIACSRANGRKTANCMSAQKRERSGRLYEKQGKDEADCIFPYNPPVLCTSPNWDFCNLNSEHTICLYNLPAFSPRGPEHTICRFSPRSSPPACLLLVAAPPQLQIAAHLRRVDTLVRPRGERRQELLAVPLAHQAGVRQHEHACIRRRADKAARRLFELQYRLGQYIAAPRPFFAQVSLARERIGRPRERQFWNHHAAKRLPARIEPLPKRLESKQRRALLGDKPVA